MVSSINAIYQSQHDLTTKKSPASYGSLARFKDIQRLHSVGSNTVLAASGDMSDFQYIQQVLDDLLISEETIMDDEHKLGPEEIHEYLSRMMYSRRSNFNPLWNSILVGGFKDGKKYEVSLRYKTIPT